MPDASHQLHGVINAAEVYTLDEVQKRLQIGQHAMRQARRAGLKVRRVGKRGFVLGADLIDFIRQEGRVG